MFDHAFPDTAKGAKQTLAMYNTIVGATIDDNHFLQLKNIANGKYTLMSPTEIAHNPKAYFQFVESYSAAIAQKYGDQKLNDATDNQMHYWLDKPVVDFVNSDALPREKGNTRQEDYEAWLKQNGMTVDHPGPSLHNRTLNLGDLNPKNTKVTADHNHVEVVFSKKGNTVSQWNVLKQQKDGTYDSALSDYDREDYAQIANTDSANYAKPTEHLWPLNQIKKITLVPIIIF